MTTVLAVFLKAPRAGSVKTRLAAEVGDGEALRLYRTMVARALAAARRSGLETTVWFAPADAAVEMRRWLGPELPLRPQAAGDLGERLAAAARAVGPGRRWLAVGGDCPRLGAVHLREAADALGGGPGERAEVVIGPTDDGGYYLVGGRTPLPDLFTGMPWSSDRVLAETRARLVRQGIRWHELPVLRDVDTAADARAEGLLA